MNAESWWRRRAGCARELMRGCFTHGMGRMVGTEPRMAAALNDVLARPGNLVRAVAAYLVGIEMGMVEEGARALACGIEYLHTASLIFDDLPAMDDARTRRGAPCLHVSHGEGVAMLAALALVNRGYGMLWSGIRRASPSRREAAGDWVDAKLGTSGLISGQAYDLSGWRGGRTAAEVAEVAARKTGDLLRLTLVLPAIAGHGTAREIQLLDRLALLRGVAYQAADDLKDVLQSDDESGKTAGRDEVMGRPNLALAEGVPAVLRRLRRLNDAADHVQSKLTGFDGRWGMLNLLRVAPPPVISVEADAIAV